MLTVLPDTNPVPARTTLVPPEASPAAGKTEAIAGIVETTKPSGLRPSTPVGSMTTTSQEPSGVGCVTSSIVESSTTVEPPGSPSG